MEKFDRFFLALLQMSKMASSSKLGAIVGALVGDASGATLEFYRGRLTAAVVKRAMTMPGGGALNVAPGQITDDGELTLALCSALKSCNPADGFPVDKVARAYADWHRSEPFDMGMTCAKAFGSISLKESDGPTVVEPGEYMVAKAAEYNMLSEANGAMMRATPIAVWYCGEGYDKVAECARADARLSHPSPVCQDVNAMYCVALAWLINNPGDAEGAIKKVESMDACDKVRQWLEDSKSEQGDCKQNIGHVKHAFTLAFHFLRKKTEYEDAIAETLIKGGDTDTNAAIVGGMMGALHGFEGVPEYMLGPVIRFDCSEHDDRKKGYKRPGVYKAANAMGFV